MLRWLQALAPREEASRRAAIAAGTLAGGRRIVQTVDSKINRLSPKRGFCAETGGALTHFMATDIGLTVSTTRTITGAIFDDLARVAHRLAG